MLYPPTYSHIPFLFDIVHAIVSFFILTTIKTPCPRLNNAKLMPKFVIY